MALFNDLGNTFANHSAKITYVGVDDLVDPSPVRGYFRDDVEVGVAGATSRVALGHDRQYADLFDFGRNERPAIVALEKELIYVLVSEGTLTYVVLSEAALIYALLLEGGPLREDNIF